MDHDKVTELGAVWVAESRVGAVLGLEALQVGADGCERGREEAAGAG